MLTTKERAKLKGLANGIDTIFQVGKGGVGESLVAQLEDALRVRELIKIKVLDNSTGDSKDLSSELAEKTDSEVVQVIGSKIILYKKNPKEPVINLKA